MTVPPLTKCSNGTSYTRMQEVEDQLTELVELPFDEIVERCAITSRAHPLFVRPECLVHLLRSTRGDNRDTRFNRLYPLMLKRVALLFPRAETSRGEKVEINAATADINEAALNRFKLLVTLDRSGGDRLDFYEVHFNEAVAKLRAKARGTIGRRVAREVTIETDPETNELPRSFEEAAWRGREPEVEFLCDPIFRSRLLPAIDDLPTEQKEVVTMTMANIPGESSDPAVPSISGILNCDPRTVHNRRVRAVATLRAKLGLGDDS
jgi:DNA-directed RNA polymerase specialized sigma24 family protein